MRFAGLSRRDQTSWSSTSGIPRECPKQNKILRPQSQLKMALIWSHWNKFVIPLLLLIGLCHHWLIGTGSKASRPERKTFVLKGCMGKGWLDTEEAHEHFMFPQMVHNLCILVGNHLSVCPLRVDIAPMAGQNWTLITSMLCDALFPYSACSAVKLLMNSSPPSFTEAQKGRWRRRKEQNMHATQKSSSFFVESSYS